MVDEGWVMVGGERGQQEAVEGEEEAAGAGGGGVAWRVG